MKKIKEKKVKPFDSKTAMYCLTIQLLSETLTYNNVRGIQRVLGLLDTAYNQDSAITAVSIVVIE